MVSDMLNEVTNREEQRVPSSVKTSIKDRALTDWVTGNGGEEEGGEVWMMLADSAGFRGALETPQKTKGHALS